MSVGDGDVGVRCRSFAKINLYLDVIGRRDDGFHDLETIFQTVNLWDELEFRLADSGLELEIEGSELSADEDNIVLRAARALHAKYVPSAGARLLLRKRIPIAAGLAGGSGDAAATLIGLNRLWDLNLSIVDLEVIGAQLGSDVPYCLHGGTMVGTGRGEELVALEAIPETWMVLAHPSVTVSTPEIFNHPELHKSGVSILEDGRSAAFSQAVKRCADGRLSDVLFNGMESAALVAYPVIQEHKNALSAAGCGAVLMSGSGPTVFGLCDDEGHAHQVTERTEGIRTTVVCTVGDGVVSEVL